MRPLRVLCVGAFPFPSGQGSPLYARGVAVGLAESGCEVELVSYGLAEARPVAGLAHVPAARVPYGDGLRSGPHPARPAHDAALAWRVAERLRAAEWDVIAAHHVEGALAGRLGRRLAGRRVPLVVHVHAALADELPDWLGPRHGRWAGAAGGLADRLALSGAQGAVVLSERGAALLAEAELPVAMIPPGISADELSGGVAERARQRWGLVGREWCLYAGNLDAYQDLPLLVAAMARVPALGLLVVSGDASAGLAQAWAAAGLAPERLRVVRAGSLAELADLHAVAAVAAIPRMRCAGFPMKLLNLAAAGVPTVVAEGSAAPIPGLWVVPNGEVGALAQGIATLAADRAGAAARGAAMQAAMRGGWSLGQRGRQLGRFYRAVRAMPVARRGLGR